MSSHEASWRSLIPGLIALAACLAAAAFVLVYARVGALRGDTFPLVVVGSTARDILEGSDVWLAGRRVGQVEAVRLRPLGTDTARRVAIDIRVYERARPLLRTDSDARIAPGGSLLGAPVLDLTAGSPDGRPLAEGDTLVMRPEVSVAAVATRLTGERAFQEVMANVQTVSRLATSMQGTVGALLGDSVAARELASLRSEVRELGRDASGVAAERARLERRLELALARADSVRRLLSSGEGTLGRFRRDSTLAAEIEDVRNELDLVRLRLELPDGTVGRALHDGIVQQQLDSVSAALDALAQDVRRRPLRYLIF